MFLLGQIVATQGALHALQDASQEPGEFLKRHARGDWGEVCAEDKVLNDRAVVQGTRLLSAYTSSKGERFWIITEADRSVTTILLPEDY
jgi:hypothetical protein